METGQLVCDLNELNALPRWGREDIQEFIQRKTESAEMAYIPEREFLEHRPRHQALMVKLNEAEEKSALPDTLPDKARAELNEYIYSIREAFDA